MIGTADVWNYVWSNRKRFTDRTPVKDQMLAQLTAAYLEQRLYVFTDRPDGNIVGVAILYFEDEKPKEAEVSLLVTTTPWALRRMWKEFRIRFPGWKISGGRRGKMKQFDVDKLDRKLSYGRY